MFTPKTRFSKAIRFTLKGIGQIAVYIFGVLKWDETACQVEFAPGKTGKSRHIYALDTSVTNQIMDFVRSTISAKTVSIFSFSIKQELFVQTVTTGTRASSAIFPGVFHLPVGR